MLPGQGKYANLSFGDTGGVYDIKNLNYLETQTRDVGRTDVVVDYRGEQFIVEMKI